MTLKLKRRQIVLASLLLALSGAVYLNWQFSPKVLTTEALNTDGKFSQDTKLVNAQINSSEFKTNSNYYETARNNRELAYKQTIEIMKQVRDDPNINKKTKEYLESETLKTTKNHQTEISIENIVKSKEIDECFVTIENGKCTIVATIGKPQDEITILNVKRIKDIANNYGIDSDKITIIPKQLTDS